MINAAVPARDRIDWVDYAKGFCIVMVVMMHSTLGVEAAAGREGWMHSLVAFAKPFRMPDFFLISGLFLARVIDRDWRTYLDRKVVHFIYFYVLWVTIQIGMKAPAVAAEAAYGWGEVARFYLMAFIEPFGTLWFIYLLPVFFVVTKLTRRVPPLAIFLIAAALEIAPIHTGWTLIDEFASRFVYFYTGYWLAPHIFRFADAMLKRPGAAVAGLAVWAIVNGVLVFAGYGDLPFMSLALGLVGAGAVVTAATLMAQSDLWRAAALLRAELDRHLPRLLPRHGGEPRRAAQVRHHHRHRHHLGAGDGRRRGRGAGALLDGARHAAARSCSSGRPGRGSSASGPRRCSRRNDLQRSSRALIQAAWRPTFGPCQHPPKKPNLNKPRLRPPRLRPIRAR